ncbi:SMC-like protein [Paenibacillus vortex V453]|uniref:Nuclease SbcCD subunit C n=1 Tax=Paenibacillus vortex V453 TaxID=715225 RepID=A0A2R9T2U1_9BACL|nr:AAA family ATPase [Paenibacillus vortex]EFU43874.1 SMC-like protein [Paenibacillus vortex V453]
MSKNLKLKNDFQNFILSEDSKLYTPDEIKLINLIIRNFDSIAEVGTAGGKRAKLLKDFLAIDWGSISSELVIASTDKEAVSFPIKQLKKITIENFRGFSNQFFHDFSKPYTLIYGTNGSGKTSFCEALEYSLLGYISEAESKRYDSNKYIVNVATGKGQKPMLTVIDENDAEIAVSASPNSYHFCFIEKNRIDGFARISANTRSNQTQMLSILLGLEDFNQYVSGFTENIENYINTNELEGDKYKNLAQKTKEVDADRVSIETNNNNVNKLKSERDLLIKASKLEMTFEEIDVYLHGVPDKNGRLIEIDEELQNISHVHYDSTGLKSITENYEEILLSLKEYKQLREDLDKSKDQISFMQLFTALKELNSISEDNCPACLTPIALVVKNPYNHAVEKLSELGELAHLEERLEVISEEIVSKTTKLIRDIDTKIKFAKELSSSVQFNFTQDLLSQELKQSNIKNKVIDIEVLINEIKRNNESLEVLEELLNFKNSEYKNSSQKKDTLQEEKKHLKGLSDKIKNIQTQESTYKKLISDAQVKIQEFDKSNAKLISEVEIEKQQVAINKEFVSAYKSLLTKLKKYNMELPGKLISNMNELTRDFYNEINKHDSDFELLEKIELPTKPEDRITAYFKDNPTKAVDALHVLSEGHVRCLGLSLLLSKIVRENINVIIFDDVVNAIDDDHRGGIREVLINSPMLKNKQIILTSHAEEFIKDLENQVGKRQYDKLITRITFLPPEKRIIRTDNISTSHYLTNA